MNINKLKEIINLFPESDGTLEVLIPGEHEGFIKLQNIRVAPIKYDGVYNQFYEQRGNLGLILE